MSDANSRFWSHVDKSGDCWAWTGSLNSHGYGKLTANKQTLAAHRVMWEMTFGAIPEGLCVLHLCDNRACVYPFHLWLGTQADNTRDRHAKGRDASGDRNGARVHPERMPRGDAHWRRLRLVT